MFRTFRLFAIRSTRSIRERKQYALDKNHEILSSGFTSWVASL